MLIAYYIRSNLITWVDIMRWIYRKLEIHTNSFNKYCYISGTKSCPEHTKMNKTPRLLKSFLPGKNIIIIQDGFYERRVKHTVLWDTWGNWGFLCWLCWGKLKPVYQPRKSDKILSPTIESGVIKEDDTNNRCRLTSTARVRSSLLATLKFILQYCCL